MCWVDDVQSVDVTRFKLSYEIIRLFEDGVS